MIQPPQTNSSLTFAGKIAVVLEMIKFQHSVFALPFALSAMLVAANGMPEWRTLFWIVVACITARSMAMSFNRLVDREYDAHNPRTKNRALPIGLVSVSFTKGFILANIAAFVLSAGMLNRLCLFFSPLVILVLLGYSYGKRFADNVHLILGLALGLAPLGAWIAVRGSLQGLPIFLSLGVILWTAGFDIIYSCQDIDCDRRDRLHSIPARLGIAPALQLAFWFHILAAVCLFLFVAESGLGIWSYLAGAVICIVLYLEHSIVRGGNLSRIGTAFFTANAIVSLVFLSGCALDILIR